MTSSSEGTWNPHCFYPTQWCAWLTQAFITVLLGPLWSRLLGASSTLEPEGYNPRGSANGLDTPLGTVQCPYLGKFFGAHPSTFRKLFPAEICFELFVIIFLAVSDSDKCWPGCRNVWVRCQVREWGATFEQVCFDLISLELSCFLVQIPLEGQDLWYVGPHSWESEPSEPISCFQLSLDQVLCCLGLCQTQGNTGKTRLFYSWEEKTHR